MNVAMLQALKIEYLNSLTWILSMLFSLDHLLNKYQQRNTKDRIPVVVFCSHNMKREETVWPLLFLKYQITTNNFSIWFQSPADPMKTTFYVLYCIIALQNRVSVFQKMSTKVLQQVKNGMHEWLLQSILFLDSSAAMSSP